MISRIYRDSFSVFKKCKYKYPFFAKMQILGVVPQANPAFSLSNQTAFILKLDNHELSRFFPNVHFTDSWLNSCLCFKLRYIYYEHYNKSLYYLSLNSSYMDH